MWSVSELILTSVDWVLMIHWNQERFRKVWWASVVQERFVV